MVWRTDLLSRGWYSDFDALQADLDRTGWSEALDDGARRIADHRRGLEVVFQGEGASGFTTVEKETTSLGTVEFALFNSGKADASSHGDRSTQTLSAHIPMLFHPGAQKVMLLGLASGMTAGEVLLYPMWIQAYEMDGETFSLLGRTFAAVFSTSALIKVGPVDYLMLGFNNDSGGFDWHVAKHNAAYAQRSTLVAFPGVDFLVHLILNEDLRQLFGPGRLHTDDRPYLEFSAPLKLYNSAAFYKLRIDISAPSNLL